MVFRPSALKPLKNNGFSTIRRSNHLKTMVFRQLRPSNAKATGNKPKCKQKHESISIANEVAEQLQCNTCCACACCNKRGGCAQHSESAALRSSSVRVRELLVKLRLVKLRLTLGALAKTLQKHSLPRANALKTRVSLRPS